jgi:hypothetical protein
MKIKAIHYYQNQIVVHPLPDGSTFIVDNKTNEILQNGYSMTPMGKAEWIETVSEIIETYFHRNVAQASEVLYKVYQKPEYQRTKLYELLPMLKHPNPQWSELSKAERKYIIREIKKLRKRGLELPFIQECLRRRSLKLITEPLGTQQAEYQLRKVGRKSQKLQQMS